MFRFEKSKQLALRRALQILPKTDHFLLRATQLAETWGGQRFSMVETVLVAPRFCRRHACRTEFNPSFSTNHPQGGGYKGGASGGRALTLRAVAFGEFLPRFGLRLSRCDRWRLFRSSRHGLFRRL